MSTTKRRVEALEAAGTGNDEYCMFIVHYWNPFTEAAMEDPKCPKGHELSRDLHECDTCSVPMKNRKRIEMIMVEAVDGKPMVVSPEGEHVGLYFPSKED